MALEPNLRIVDEREFVRGLRVDEAADRRRRARIDHLLQLAIVLLSGAALWMITSADPATMRRGFIIGLASQPFWIAATWRGLPRQWGMFIVALAYTLLWVRGIINAFS